MIKHDTLGNLRLLYVEDDLETREELQSILALYVAELYTAKNGREGLAMFRQHLPDIVVTDIQMPEMNGLSMAADIKAANPEQAIVVLSAYNDVEYLFRALELNIQHYVTKPISVERLLSKLSEIGQQMHLAREARQSTRLLEQYKLLVDEKAIVVKVDLDGKMTYVNRHFCALSGYQEQEVLGKHFLFSATKTDTHQLFETIKTTLLNQRKWTGMLKQRAKSGDDYVVDVSVIAVYDADDQLEEYVALMVDMTEIYEKFERLSLSLKEDLDKQQHFMREYERALDVGTSLCIIDIDGKIVSNNRNFSASLNFDQDELLGRSFFDLVRNGSDLKDRVLKKVADHGFSSRVIKITGKDGLPRTLSTVIVGIRNQGGDTHSLMSLSHDISDTVQLSEDIIENQKDLIYVLGEVVENRSQETGLHIKRVAVISEFLARQYGLSDEHAAMIKVASPLHDIGKIGVPDDILNKPGRLTSEEYRMMQKHTDLGFTLLNKLDRPLIKMAATIAHEHHEHYNGEGYPLGLSGEHIAIEARIVSLVDVFDALGSRRIYKEPWPDDKIIDYLQQNRGRQFDPELVDLFMSNLDNILAIRNHYGEAK